ncbi:Glyoxylase, beta-lactamase superfamily II [Duganella sp. CF402]|uniref:MBL fold metallo-hydrolase n=1 Tax=unclassified Duganella TaxID=2636909 RepID=UPI0008D6807A|nr:MULTISPECIES: MBL fold metallo-hydrolase [unclassified Duganella]RZT09847.1 glyoxylase-like metal-dependent hydrolase (beta-lactamase superfamily II) [Duganella sp. BK701]SEL40324.1 Glyoxylase, beta-lactamase superfamily II [Duganella sp. CF402]
MKFTPLLAALAISAPAFAAAPLAGTNAPGFHRIMLGDFEITAISDGTVDLPVDKLLHQPAAATTKALARNFQSVPTETSVNGFLVNTGSKLILIDTGAGGLFGPTLGKLAANLKAAGYQPEQVDEIYLTHLHPDHVGGLAANSQSVFPNAVVRADQRDTDFWLSQANQDKAPADSKGFFQGAVASLSPYAATQHLKPFSGDTELAPGVRATSTYGHTPGHTIYTVESKGKKLVLLGDLIHVGAVQFDHPEVTIGFDSDAKAAAAARAKVFQAVAKDGALVGVSHLSFPGLGHLRSNGKGYQWVPVAYTQLR